MNRTLLKCFSKLDTVEFHFHEKDIFTLFYKDNVTAKMFLSSGNLFIGKEI